MNILLCSVPFAPSVGGIETVSALLADQFQRRGHAVTVLTQTAAAGTDSKALQVLRQPDFGTLWRAVRDADVVLHNQISLRFALPLLAWRRPWVVAHHMWIPRSGPDAAAGDLKRLALRAAQVNVAASHALAAALPVAATVIPNPYDTTLFRRMNEVERARDIVVLGRLVSDKGLPVLLHALAALRSSGRYASASIIGSGPEAAALKTLTQQLGLSAQVRFAGALQGESLVRALNAHRIAVVPSVWEEPFGLVALETQACGCVPVVSSGGGLTEAAGPAGVVFQRGDSDALARCLRPLLAAPAGPLPMTDAVARHLERHRPEAVAAAYLETLEHARYRVRPLARAN